MKFLVRFFIFLSLLCSLAFSKNCAGSGLCLAVLDRNLDSSFKPIDGKFLKGNHFGIRSPEYGYYFVYSFIIRDEAYYFAGSKAPGFYKGFGNDYSYIHSTPKTGRFGQRGGVGDYEYYVVSDYPKDPVFTYYDFILFNSKQIARCSLNQEFNTDTMQCVDTCPAGQKWDVDINACANDCTDKNLNKFGFFNGTTQGKCVDCSNVYSDRDIATCLCTGLGSSFGGSVVFVSDTENPSIVRSSCDNGTPIIFKRRSDEDPNKNKDKDKEDPNKDKDKDKENPDKDKDKDKDNNNSTPGNGGGSSGGNNNGSSGNNGGSSGGTGGGSSGGTGGGSGGGSSGGSGGGTGGGSSGGGQGGGKDPENATPGNIDYGELEERTADLANTYKENINNLFEPIDGIKKSLNDTISKIKDGNLMSLKKGGIPNTCPLNFDVDMVFFSKKVVFDFCSILSPIASSLYVFFFVAFFLLFLFLIAKLFIFTFMGW
ncbi:hypothetical protein CCON61_01300 [Campylobacter concisus]|nr:hypothetical protein CCON61_01300 [Campylobacter concisus]